MQDGPRQFGSRSRSTGPFERCVLERNNAPTAKEMSGVNRKGPLFVPAGVFTVVPPVLFLQAGLQSQHCRRNGIGFSYLSWKLARRLSENGYFSQSLRQAQIIILEILHCIPVVIISAFPSGA